MRACPACGRINDPARKFCGGCGTSLVVVIDRIPEVPEGPPMAPQLAPGLVPARRGIAASLKLGLLLVVLTAGLVALGSLFGSGGAAVFLVLAVLLNFGAYWFSDRLVILATGAKEVSREQAPQLHEIVETLAARAGIPKPKVCLMETAAPNAFATGRHPGRAVVAVTRGLLEILNRHELEGVLAHELGHVLNRDILISSVVACLCGAIMFLATVVRWGALFAGGGNGRTDGLVLVFVGLLAPLGALLVQLGISRSREYRADDTGARLSGKPLALAGALQRIEAASQLAPMRVSPQAAHLFLIPPLPKGWLATLFSTHPSTAKRVQRLKSLVR